MILAALLYIHRKIKRNICLFETLKWFNFFGSIYFILFFFKHRVSSTCNDSRRKKLICSIGNWKEPEGNILAFTKKLNQHIVSHRIIEGTTIQLLRMMQKQWAIRARWARFSLKNFEIIYTDTGDKWGSISLAFLEIYFRIGSIFSHKKFRLKKLIKINKNRSY